MSFSTTNSRLFPEKQGRNGNKIKARKEAAFFRKKVLFRKGKGRRFYENSLRREPPFGFSEVRFLVCCLLTYSSVSDKNTHSDPKYFGAVPAERPGDSQGGGFSAAPLEPASYQFSCRNKKIASGGTSAETFCESWNARIDLQFTGR